MALNSVQCLYTAKMGLATISTANANLDGTGSLGTVITGASNGTIIKTLIVKAQTDTSQGMVRLFVKKGGGSNILLSEIYIPPIIKSGRDLSYSNVIPLNYKLESGEILKASTENADTFNIIAEAFDISYNASGAFLNSSLEYTTKAGVEVITTANSNLDGTGAIVQILVAGAAASNFLGCAISSIVIKAQQTTSPGMVRLYVKDTGGGSVPVLFSEIQVPSVIQSPSTQAFSFQAIVQGSFCIPPDYKIYASTELTNTFSVIAEGVDWKYI